MHVALRPRCQNPMYISSCFGSVNRFFLASSIFWIMSTMFFDFNTHRYTLKKCMILCIITSVFQAEARLAAKRAARAEARSIRMKELEKAQQQVS